MKFYEEVLDSNYGTPDPMKVLMFIGHSCSNKDDLYQDVVKSSPAIFVLADGALSIHGAYGTGEREPTSKAEFFAAFEKQVLREKQDVQMIVLMSSLGHFQNPVRRSRQRGVRKLVRFSP